MYIHPIFHVAELLAIRYYLQKLESLNITQPQQILENLAHQILLSIATNTQTHTTAAGSVWFDPPPRVSPTARGAAGAAPARTGGASRPGRAARANPRRASLADGRGVAARLARGCTGASASTGGSGVGG